MRQAVARRWSAWGGSTPPARTLVAKATVRTMQETNKENRDRAQHIPSQSARQAVYAIVLGERHQVFARQWGPMDDDPDWVHVDDVGSTDTMDVDGAVFRSEAGATVVYCDGIEEVA